MENINDKIEKGVEVLCIHDTLDKKIGDRSIVYGFGSPCGHLILEDSQLHYEREHFTAFSDGPVKHEDPNQIDVTKILNLMDDITRTVMLNQEGGVVPIDAITRVIRHTLDALDLKNQYFSRGNKPNQN